MSPLLFFFIFGCGATHFGPLTDEILDVAHFTLSEPFTVFVPETPVSVRRGRTAKLPCWLSPSVNAEALEVRWYRDDEFDAPALLYRAGQFLEGQTFFGLRDAKSDGLKAGDVTLEMANVTFKEAGEYTCYVRSDQGYDKASIFLHVTGEIQFGLVQFN